MRKSTASIINDYFSPSNMLKYPHRYVTAGLIAADGCIHYPKSGQPQIVFNISEKDKTMLDLLNQEIASGSRSINNIKNNGSVMITFPSRQLIHDLAIMGIKKDKTYHLRLPQLNNLNTSYFFRGYFYGDGCVYGKGGRRKYALLGNDEFIQDIQNYLLLHTQVTNVYIQNRSKTHSLLEIYGKQAAFFSDWLFQNDNLTFLPRKNVKTSHNLPFAHWSKPEDQALMSMDIDEFCKKYGRTIGSAKQRKRKITKTLCVF